MFTHAQRISVFAVAATGLFAQTVTTPPTQETRTSGVVGIAEGQTARFNVLNARIPSATAAGCSAVLTFYDGKGVVLKTATVSAVPGTAGYLDLFGDTDLMLAADDHKQIRATFSVPLVMPAATLDSATKEPVCRLIGTLEIFDKLTLRTEVVLGGDHLVQ